ncbi:MAG: SCO family protein [Sulfuricurvum sp.]|nr:SCO family protein [Sulfuricurvum sp.]
MNKKIILAIIFFILLLVIFPFVQTFFFSQQTSGKIVIDQPIDAPYLQHPKKDLTLVFFGYVGCTKVCTPILHQVDDFYDSPSFAPLKPFVGFSFVNLMPEIAPDQPKAFAQSFNPAFDGVYLTQKELMGIDRDFSLFFSKSLADSGEIDHSDHLYLIETQQSGTVVLKNIYTTHPINKSLIIADIYTYLNETK